MLSPESLLVRLVKVVDWIPISPFVDQTNLAPNGYPFEAVKLHFWIVKTGPCLLSR